VLYYLHYLKAGDSWRTIFNVFQYVTVRAAIAATMAFLICVLLGPWVIRRLRALKVTEKTANPNSAHLTELHSGKKDTPTMGGALLFGAFLAAGLICARPTNIFVLLCLGVVVALLALGFADDYVKLKVSKKGLSIRTKLFWQTLVGAGVAAVLSWGAPAEYGTLSLPFVKPETLAIPLGMLFIPFAVIVVVGASNAVNLTDGLDGLAAGCGVIVALTYAVIAYLVGHAEYAPYLKMPFVSGAEECAVLCAALAGAGIGFLWFNAHPAEIFMGDAGALPLGGLLGTVALVVKQELLLTLAGGIFVAEALSVALQIFSFRMFGKRIFRIAPLHHHFEFSGLKETKIVARFWIVAVILATASLLSLKVR
jgi:phospho-N-acetylmuramoyl-pentapeptide-transferase